MNILMVSDVYFPRINGVSTSIQTFKRDLEALGHRVVLMAPEYPSRQVFEKDLLRVPSRRVLFDPEDRMMKKSAAMALLDQLQLYDFDLVHIQTPFVAHYLGIRLARKLGVPCVVSYHTFFEEYLFHYLPFVPGSLMRYLARRFSRRQCNQVDGVVVPSSAMASVLRDYGVRQQLEVLPTGLGQTDGVVNVDRCAVDDFKQNLGISHDRPCLVHVGRIAFEKNIEFLIHVVARVRTCVPDLAVIIAGEGPALKSVRSLVDRLGLGGTVYFVGYLDRSTELKTCYRSADVFIFASRTETQGLVLLEAMALGVPVVSTAVMGTRDILEPLQGALVAEEDLDDFAGKVERLLKDRELRDRLSGQARQYVHQWSAVEMAARMQAFYAGIIEAQPAFRRQAQTEPG